MDELSTKLSSEVKEVVDNCFASMNSRVIFTSKVYNLLPIKMSYLPEGKVISFMNTSATVAVGT